MTEIKTILKDYCEKFNSDLERYFPQSNLEQHKAFRAMYYSLSNGGKRLRPFLLHKTAASSWSFTKHTRKTGDTLESHVIFK